MTRVKRNYHPSAEPESLRVKRADFQVEKRDTNPGVILTNGKNLVNKNEMLRLAQHDVKCNDYSSAETEGLSAKILMEQHLPSILDCTTERSQREKLEV